MASHLVNSNFGIHERSEFFEYRWIIGLYLLAAAMLITTVSPKGIKVFLSLTSLVCAFYLIDFAIHPPASTEVFGLPNRMVGFLHSPTDFGHAVQFLFLFPLVLLIIPFKEKDLAFKGLLVAAVLFSGTNLLLSFTRTSQLSCLITILGLVLAMYRRHFLKITSALLIVGFALFVGNIGGFRQRILFSLHPEQTYDNNRILLWKFNWSLFKDNPIFGVGYHHNLVKFQPSYNIYQIPERYYEAHAHNQFLNFMGGTGILGLTWYLLIMFLFGRMAFQNTKRFAKNTLDYAVAIATIVLLVAFIISGFTDTNFELIAPHYYLAFTWALILYQRHKPIDAKAGNKDPLNA